MTHGPPARRKQNADQDDDSNQLPTPPDGGWGWMVVFGSFMIHIINDGITYSFGLFYYEFVTYFNESKSFTAWIVSILVGVTLCSGPISSAFVNRYGCRAVTIAGAILGFICILVSMFAQNVATLMLTVGLGAGFGFGLVYLPAIVSVTMYFEARRSLATGIAVCGSGLGTFIFAPITETLIQEYGWRNAMLILSAIVFNCTIFGALFRPLEPTKKKKKRRNLKHSNDTELQPLKNKSPNKNGNANVHSGEQPSDEDGDQEQFISRSHSLGFDTRKSLNKTENTKPNGGSNNNLAPEYGSGNENLRPSASHSDIYLKSRKIGETRHISASGTMYRPDALYTGSLLNIQSSLGELSMKEKYGSFSRHGETHGTKLCGCIPCSKETYDTFSEMMDFSLFKDWIFVIYTISNFLTSLGFNVPYVYLKSQASDLNLDSHASYLLATIGLSNTFSRVILGYISDKAWVNRLLLYIICLIVCGLSVMLSIFCTSFIGLTTYVTVYGTTIGAYVGLTSVILVDLLGLDKLTNAFGLLLLFQGIASFLGAPFAGWLYDISGNLNLSFLTAGGSIVISGLILFAIPPIQKYRARINTDRDSPENDNMVCV
uniref:Putative monocarboxylate transporter n=1 Tax=Tabanus bromius TaxID=304241 RepID=A0A0K8TLS6_TABBR